jgi:hypothetical protein
LLHGAPLQAGGDDDGGAVPESKPLNTFSHRGVTVVSVAQRYKVAFLLALVLLVPIAVHAVSFGVTTNPVKDDIQRNESAVYEVVISNFEQNDASYQIYTIDPGWNTKVEPLDTTVPPQSQRTFMLYLRPASSAKADQAQGVTVNFKDLSTGSVIKKPLFVVIRENTQGPAYPPNVNLDVLMPYDIDPRNPIPLRLDIRNRNQLNLSNITILVSSPQFSAQESVSLPPLSEKTKDIERISVPATTMPGEQEMNIQLVYQGKVIAQLVKNYRIKEYTQVTQQVSEQSFFFKTEKTIEITNEGNVKNTAIVSVPTSFIKSLFISSNLPYESEVRDGVRVIFWSIPLDPYGTRSFTYTENYRILVLLFLLALISAIVYLLLRSPVIAVKEAVAIPHGGGVSDIKVRVFVKNRSAKLIQGIQVTDRVPSLADVVKSESPGSMSPTKMATSEKGGTLLRWDLEVLEPFEERILTYQVKSKLKIIGHMKLPNAKIRFTVNSKERAVYSNNIELVEKFKDQ